MPIYSMINPDTGKQEDVLCSIADMEVLKQEGWISILSAPKVISGRQRSGNAGSHGTDEGWKDTLRRIRDNNPGSTIDV